MAKAQALETAVKQGPKSFVVNILTSKPKAFKILQTIIAKPAPVKFFREVGGGGYPLRTENSPATGSSLHVLGPQKEIFSRKMSTA
jgi:hypothetical protein